MSDGGEAGYSDRLLIRRSLLQSTTMLAVSHPISVPDPSSVPSNAPEHCPGVESDLAGKADACAGCANQEICASNKPKGPDPALPFIRERMSSVRRKILVLSGKGGVGKSTFCAQLAWAFAADESTQVCVTNTQLTSLIGTNGLSHVDRDNGH